MVRRGQGQLEQIVQHFAVPEKDLAPSERDGAAALWSWVMIVAMLPSITLSKVDGMPNGRKLSAVGPILAFGIHA